MDFWGQGERSAHISNCGRLEVMVLLKFDFPFLAWMRDDSYGRG